MRKLAIAAFSFSAAIFASNYIFSRELALYAALFCALAGAAVLGIRLKCLRGIVISAFAAAIGFAVFAAHYDLTVEKAHQIAGETREFEFTLLQNPQAHRNYTSAEARLESEGHPRLKCILYATDGNMGDLSGGDRIRAQVRLSAADIRFGKHTDRYNAKDIYLTGTVKGEIQTTGRRHSIASLSSAAAEKIAQRMDAVFDRSTAPFVKALIIGDKRDLYEDDALYVSLSRAGLMHVVAVSGMHVSFLIAFLRFIFGKGKKSSIFCILLAWTFVAISGMTPSAVRAAFMQTMLLLAPLFERENDPITSLSAALGVLLLFNPFAASNISLQLSFAAMLGIVLFFERIQEYLTDLIGDGKAAEMFKAPLAVLSCSLSVMVFSLPITSLYFGYISVLSPLANLLCIWAVPICFVGAFAAGLFSWVPVLGRLLSLVVSCLVRYLLAVCRWIASLSFSVVYLPTWVNLLWILFVYILLAAVFLFKLRPALKILLPLLAAGAGLFAAHAAIGLYYDSARETITAIDVGQGQCISVMCGNNVVLIDCGSTSYAEYEAGDCAASYLKSCGKEKIDALVFTHLHTDHANGFERLSDLIDIEKIMIPSDTDAADPLLWKILSQAREHGTEVEFVSKSKMEKFGDIRLLFFAEKTDGEGNERCMPLIVSVDDYDVIISGDAPEAKEKTLADRADLSGIEAVVVGHHGSKTSSCEEYLSEMAGGSAIISVGKNSYGLPSPEVLERLERFGYTVYRTDLNGNVELRIDG